MPLSSERIKQFIETLRLDSHISSDLQHSGSQHDQLLTKLENYLSGSEKQVPDVLDLSNWYCWIYLRQLTTLFNEPLQWNQDDHQIFRIFIHKDLWIKGNSQKWDAGQGSTDFLSWVNTFTSKDEAENQKLVHWFKELMQTHQLSEADLLQQIAQEGDSDYPLVFKQSIFDNVKQRWTHEINGVTFIGSYILSFLPDQKQDFIKLAKKHYRADMMFFILIATHSKDMMFEFGEEFIVHKDKTEEYLEELMIIDAVGYESFVLELMQMSWAKDYKHVFTYLLETNFPGKYRQQFIEESYPYLTGTNFSNGWRTHNIERVNYLLTYDKDNFVIFLKDYLTRNYLPKGYWIFKVVHQYCQEKTPEILAPVLDNKDIIQYDFNYFRELFDIFERYDLNKYEEKLWNIARHKSKPVRQLMATVLAKAGDVVIPKAQELLSAKAADARQTGALILSKIKTPVAEEILLNAVNTEKNDDTRDVMLEALGEKRYFNLSEEQIAENIWLAWQRGKLDQPLEKWLDSPELVLPENEALHKIISFLKSKLSADQTIPAEVLVPRFLLYRMSRAREIRSDMEAKPLLQLLEREKTETFAKKLFKAFIDNGADAKQKYCLALAGFLGSNDMVDILRSQVNKWVEASRGKMAEYAVVALALIGNNKALRAVEFFSRKYKNKYSNIGEAALNALKIAAEELNMDMNELADSIIPDFGFENMYKTFKVGEEEYRAFINKDFKLAFLNEDGKLLKSAPKGTDKQQLEEFKEIGKEVRDVVKSQSSRMELYLVIQRKWEAEKWQQFFVGNPIMFVYATHIIWGIFDLAGTLTQTFYCAEDTSLLSINDEEVLLPDNSVIGMVHPLSVSEEEKNQWIQKFYEFEIEPIFPQMQRPVVKMSEKDKSQTQLTEFEGKKGQSVAVKGAFRRYGWIAWSVEDHGDISSFAKNFDTFGIQALIETSGGLFLGYDDDSWAAEFGRLYFRKMGGSWNSPDVPFSEIPEIVYSEVVSELRNIITKEEEVADKS
jgi:hypothetical protein